jgi:hypothetical protein
VEALEFDYFDDLWFLLPLLVCVSVCVLTVESGILLSFYYLEDYGLMGLFLFFFLPLVNEEEKIVKVIKLRQEFTFAWYFGFGPCGLELNIERF